MKDRHAKLGKRRRDDEKGGKTRKKRKRVHEEDEFEEAPTVPPPLPGEAPEDKTLDFRYGSDCCLFSITVEGITLYCCCTNAANTFRLGIGDKTINLPLLAGNYPHLAPDNNSRRFAAGFFRISTNIDRMRKGIVKELSPDDLDDFGEESGKALHQSCFCLQFTASKANITGPKDGLSGLAFGHMYCNMLSTWMGIPAVLTRFETNNQVVICYSDYSIDLADLKCKSAIRNFITYEPQKFPLAIIRNRVLKKVAVSNSHEGVFDPSDPIYFDPELQTEKNWSERARIGQMIDYETKCCNVAVMCSEKFSMVVAGLNCMEQSSLFMKMIAHYVKPFLKPKGSVTSKKMVKKMQKTYEMPPAQVMDMVKNATGSINEVLKFGLKSLTMAGNNLPDDLRELSESEDDDNERPPDAPAFPPRMEEMFRAVDEMFPKDGELGKAEGDFDYMPVPSNFG